MGNFLMAANETLKKTEVTTVETKPVVKDSLSALLTNGGDSAATKKKAITLRQNIAQGGGPVLGLFSPKDTATVNGYFKRQEVRNLLSADQL
jgi:SecD/SecF fusion protein